MRYHYYQRKNIERIYMTAISDDFMKRMMGKTKQYCIVILKPGPHKNDEGAEKIIWEHGRRNFALREEGLLSIVCPIRESTLAGVGIFNASTAEVQKIMDEDPAVKAGVLLYETYMCRSFPGDSLP